MFAKLMSTSRVVIFCRAISIASFSSANADEVYLNIVTRPGQTVQLDRHSSVWNDCTISQAVVFIKQYPSHGRLNARVGNNLIRGGLNVRSYCFGKTGPGTIISYTPRAGFVGIDEVAYGVVFTGMSGSTVHREFSMRVDVRRKGATASQAWTDRRFTANFR